MATKKPFGSTLKLRFVCEMKWRERWTGHLLRTEDDGWTTEICAKLYENLFTNNHFKRFR